jgi:hypothetical protein
MAMKKARQSKNFLEEFSKTPNVSGVCIKLGLSRQTVYRWLEEDADFSEKYEECLNQGVNNINDLAESKLITYINEGKPWAIKFWLENNKKNYTKPKSKDFWESMGGSDKVKKITIETLLPRPFTDKDLIDNKESRKQFDDTLPLS